MIILVWVVAVISAQGPMTSKIPETTKFQTSAECNKFGKSMTPRLQDWVRGNIGADWDFQVAVRFSCAPAGEPA